MAKIHSVYPHAKLIECPERWEHYKEIEDAALILVESEHKRPGQLGFNFSGLKSSFITDLETKQETINDSIEVHIWTHDGEHLYVFEVWYDNYGNGSSYNSFDLSDGFLMYFYQDAHCA